MRSGEKMFDMKRFQKLHYLFHLWDRYLYFYFNTQCESFFTSFVPSTLFHSCVFTCLFLLLLFFFLFVIQTHRHDGPPQLLSCQHGHIRKSFLNPLLRPITLLLPPVRTTTSHLRTSHRCVCPHPESRHKQ